MLRVILIRPGATDFDEQGRIAGLLDIPLCPAGVMQSRKIRGEIEGLNVEAIYTSPCQAAVETAKSLAETLHVKVKELDALQNMNFGLWQGKLVTEVKERQPKVYRRLQEDPETICPPEGETICGAKDRVRTALAKLLKKHRSGVIAIIAPEPIASVVGCQLRGDNELGDFWKNECGTWEQFDVAPEALLALQA